MDMTPDCILGNAMFAAENCNFMAACPQTVHHFQAQHAIAADVVGRVIVGKH